MKKKKWIHLLILMIFLYGAGGILLPFAETKQVQGNLMETEEFYGDHLSDDRAAVIESNQEALDIRLSMFDKAQKSIALSTFDIRDGRSTRDIFSSLLSAADRGVKVKIIVDGLYGMIHMSREPVFYAAGSHDNIEIKYYNTPNLAKPWTFNGRMHDKYILVDDEMLLMGGRNTFDYFLGEYPDKGKGYDREVLIYNQDKDKEDSVIEDVRKYFNDIWNSKECKNKFENTPIGKKEEIEKAEDMLSERYAKINYEEINYEERTIPVDKAVFIHNPTHIYGKEPYVWEQLQKIMEDAKEKVTIQTPYVVFSDDMYKGMEKIVKKVPDTKILINSIASGDNICASSDYIRNKSKVLETGADLYEYMGKYSAHGKSLTIDDDLSVIGSYNFDNRSTYVDTETMIVIDSKELNKELTLYLDDFEKGSLQVKNETEYVKNEKIKENKISSKKENQIKMLSVVIRWFRNLI